MRDAPYYEPVNEFQIEGRRRGSHSLRETFARIGWIEGLGRIHEQYALYWKAKAAHSRRSSDRQRAYVKGTQHARTACALFERIGLHRMVGRTEALLGELGQKVPGPIA